MTDTFNRYGIRETDHTKFGGVIYSSDFNTDYRGKDNTNGSTIASRIESDKRWEEKMLKTKGRNKQYGK